MGELFRFPTALREVPSVTTHDTGHPQSNAYGFPPVEEERERVEITAGLTKVWAVRVDTAIWSEFNSTTLAIRCAEHLRGLDRLGCLYVPPSETVRAMFVAAVAEIEQ